MQSTSYILFFAEALNIIIKKIEFHQNNLSALGILYATSNKNNNIFIIFEDSCFLNNTIEFASEFIYISYKKVIIKGIKFENITSGS